MSAAIIIECFFAVEDDSLWETNMHMRASA